MTISYEEKQILINKYKFEGLNDKDIFNRLKNIDFEQKIISYKKRLDKNNIDRDEEFKNNFLHMIIED